MTDLKAPTLDQIAYVKMRLRTLPDELNVAREAVSRLAADVRDQKLRLADQEAEVAAFVRAELIEANRITGTKTYETTLTLAVKDAADKHEGLRHHRQALRESELRKEGAELTVKHLADRFAALQVYADLTCAEVRLFVGGLGA